MFHSLPFTLNKYPSNYANICSNSLNELSSLWLWFIFQTCKNFNDNSKCYFRSKNLVLYSRVKHIDIKHHFIRDHVLKGYIDLFFVSIDFRLADIFVKPLLEERFCSHRKSLGIIAKSFWKIFTSISLWVYLCAELSLINIDLIDVYVI